MNNPSRIYRQTPQGYTFELADVPYPLITKGISDEQAQAMAGTGSGNARSVRYSRYSPEMESSRKLRGLDKQALQVSPETREILQHNTIQLLSHNDVERLSRFQGEDLATAVSSTLSQPLFQNDRNAAKLFLKEVSIVTGQDFTQMLPPQVPVSADLLMRAQAIKQKHASRMAGDIWKADGYA